jgi:hypothetical protein
MPFAQMETRLLMATILQRYAPRRVPGFPVVLQPRVTLRPKYGMGMILGPTTKSVETAHTRSSLADRCSGIQPDQGWPQ